MFLLSFGLEDGNGKTFCFRNFELFSAIKITNGTVKAVEKKSLLDLH